LLGRVEAKIPGEKYGSGGMGIVTIGTNPRGGGAMAGGKIEFQTTPNPNALKCVVGRGDIGSAPELLSGGGGCG
jgi:hypothetical protein